MEVFWNLPKPSDPSLSVHAVQRNLVACPPEGCPYSAQGGFMSMFLTCGGRISCLQCSAQSKRTGQQCRAPAIAGKNKCRFHGGKSTGPKTTEGRMRCAQARIIHGKETNKARTERTLAAHRLRDLEIIGRSIGLIHGTKTAGRKPK